MGSYPFIKDEDGNFIELNPNKFNLCVFRAGPTILINKSTCCGESAEVKYSCSKKEINDLDHLRDCLRCKEFKEKE